MMTWTPARHRVAIAGHVTDAVSQKAVVGAEVTILEMPPAFKQKLQHAGASRTLDKARTGKNGLFYFLDLPDGKYVLVASLPGAGKRYGNAQQKAKVSRDEKGDTKIAFVNLTLQPTVVKGKITGAGHKAGVVMAQVQVKGSGERVFSDLQGEYKLTAIEPGSRTLQVFAQGYRPASEVLLIVPGEIKTQDFDLGKGPQVIRRNGPTQE
jgi:hypothetical protein